MKDGFLDEPEKPGTAGKRFLHFNARDGQFTLMTRSYAKINCPDMEFGMYPFDSNKCEFLIYNPDKNISYQV